MLFRVLAAANFMEIPPLLDLTCLWCTFQIHGKSAEEVRAAEEVAACCSVLRFRCLLTSLPCRADTNIAQFPQHDSRGRSAGTRGPSLGL
jgi:hypothetical protein